MDNKTNNIITIIIGVLLVLLIIGETITTTLLFSKVHSLSNQINNLKMEVNGQGNNTQEYQDGYDTSKFKEIDGKDIKKESKDKTIVVLVARQSCGFCSLYAPIITEVSEEKEFVVRYIDLEKIIDVYSPGWDIIDQESYDTLVSLPTIEGYETFMDDFGATPMTIVIKNGKIIGGVVGYVQEETLIEALKDSGFLK